MSGAVLARTVVVVALVGIFAGSCHGCFVAHPIEKKPVKKAPRTSKNDVALLVDQGEVFPAALDLIKNAKKEVLIGMYLLGGEAATKDAPAGIGRAIVDEAAARMKAGVDVRIINQQFTAMPDRRKTPIANDPWYHPVFDYAKSLGVPIIDPCTGPGSIDHTKYLVVDGEVALFGGMNFADAVASNHDVMLRVKGPFVAELRRLFQDAWRCALRAAQAANKVDDAIAEAPAFQKLAAPKEVVAPTSCSTRLLVTKPPRRREIFDGIRNLVKGAGAGDDVRVAMLLLKSTRIESELLAAKKRGASVEVLLDPSASLYGVDCQGVPNADAVTRLTKAGVDVRWFKTAPGQELHMKVGARKKADGTIAFGLGSANWTEGALKDNWETYATFTGCPAVGAKLWSVLERDWRENSTPIGAEQVASFEDLKSRAALELECERRLKEESFRAIDGDE